jgi:hypothetical protein
VSLLLLPSWLLSLLLLLVPASNVLVASSCVDASALSRLLLLLLSAAAVSAAAAAAGMSGALGHQYMACCSAAVCFDRNFMDKFWRSCSSSSSSMAAGTGH